MFLEKKIYARILCKNLFAEFTQNRNVTSKPSSFDLIHLPPHPALLGNGTAIDECGGLTSIKAAGAGGGRGCCRRCGIMPACWFGCGSPHSTICGGRFSKIGGSSSTSVWTTLAVPSSSIAHVLCVD
eukprot:Trichotokara_eunicae@DN3339_c0_g1_i3.p1